MALVVAEGVEDDVFEVDRDLEDLGVSWQVCDPHEPPSNSD
jgi:hypothetical protein